MENETPIKCIFFIHISSMSATEVKCFRTLKKLLSKRQPKTTDGLRTAIQEEQVNLRMKKFNIL